MDKISGIPVFCSFSEERSTEDLLVHSKSPYIHSQTQATTLARVIKSNGWRNSIVVSDRDKKTIVKGRLLYETAIAQEWESVPVEYQSYSSVGEEIADMIADNKVTSMSEIDNFILGDVMEHLSDIGGDILNTGFEQHMIDAITGKLDEYISIGGEQEFDVEEEEASIKTLKLIYDNDEYKLFTTLMTAICDKESKLPSQVISDLAHKAYDLEN